METKWTKASLLPEKSGLTLRDVEAGDKGWVVRAEGAGSSICPVCGVKSSHRHSRYWRNFKDLPVQGVPVTLRVRLGRWRCRNTNCERKIFTERIPAVAAAHRQRTERLGEYRSTRRPQTPFWLSLLHSKIIRSKCL